MVTEAAPLFEAVTVSVALVPAVTPAKFTLLLLSAKLPDCGC